MKVEKKCIFEEKLICQDIEFCDNCPVYYDWAVYFIYSKSSESEEKEKDKD